MNVLYWIYSLGKHRIHMNHLRLVRKRFSQLDHGLKREDVYRNDRQNFASAQRLVFPRVQECLLRISNGESELCNNNDYDCLYVLGSM